MEDQQQQGRHRHERYSAARPRYDYDERNPAHGGYGQEGFASGEQEHSGDLHEEPRGRRPQPREGGRDERAGHAGHDPGGSASRRRHGEQGSPAGGRSYAQEGPAEARREGDGEQWQYQRGGYDLAGGYESRSGSVRERRGPKNYTRPDHAVRDEVCSRLVHQTRIDLDDVEVEVREGRVELRGTVPLRRDRHLIEDIAADVWGVKGVDNRIAVTAAAPGAGGQRPPI